MRPKREIWFDALLGITVVEDDVDIQAVRWSHESHFDRGPRHCFEQRRLCATGGKILSGALAGEVGPQSMSSAPRNAMVAVYSTSPSRFVIRTLLVWFVNGVALPDLPGASTPATFASYSCFPWSEST